MTAAIDTLQYARKLRAAGVPRDVAEAHAEALGDAVRDSLVTKSDLNEGLEKLRSDLHGEIGEVRREMHVLHNSLLRWLIPLMIGQTAAFAAIVKLL